MEAVESVPWLSGWCLRGAIASPPSEDSKMAQCLLDGTASLERTGVDTGGITPVMSCSEFEAAQLLDAITYLPSDVSSNVRARLFGYRGAMAKRLGRLDEVLADLEIARKHATADYEVEDVLYNLASVYAMNGDRDARLRAVRALATAILRACTIPSGRICTTTSCDSVK